MVYLVGGQEKLDKRFNIKTKKYSKLFYNFPNGFKGFLISQYITFKIFKEGGVGKNYLNHRLIKNRDKEEIDYLKNQLKIPWRFSFCRVKNFLDDNVYEMEEIGSDSSFILLSGGLEEILNVKGENTLFFLLIGSNGEVWQSFGPLSYTTGFTNRDILIFSQEVDKNVKEYRDIPSVINRRPFPFMMLFLYAELPKIIVDNETIKLTTTSIKIETPLDMSNVLSNFAVKESCGVYRIINEELVLYPNFAQVFYDTNKKILRIETSTLSSYKKMSEQLNEFNIYLPKYPNSEFSPLCLNAINDIIDKDFGKSHYSYLFDAPKVEKYSANKIRVEKALNYIYKLKKSNIQFSADSVGKKCSLNSSFIEEILSQIDKQGSDNRVTAEEILDSVSSKLHKKLTDATHYLVEKINSNESYNLEKISEEFDVTTSSLEEIESSFKAILEKGIKN